MLGNLRSISIRTMQETQKSKLGLVVEGGGVRAICAAGVLAVLHDMRLPFVKKRQIYRTPFDIYSL